LNHQRKVQEVLVPRAPGSQRGIGSNCPWWLRGAQAMSQGDRVLG
jgi:hypothetical protein